MAGTSPEGGVAVLDGRSSVIIETENYESEGCSNPMSYDKDLKLKAEKILREATWTCEECDGDMPLEYEEDDEDDVGYHIMGASCDNCGMRYDRTINNAYGKKLDECSTMELLGM